jgi:hypothetical protein
MRFGQVIKGAINAAIARKKQEDALLVSYGALCGWTGDRSLWIPIKKYAK